MLDGSFSPGCTSLPFRLEAGNGSKPNLNKILMGAIIISILAISGCSVGMAMSGKKEPNLGAIRVGVTKGEVELQLGHPVSVVTAEDGGCAATYEYEIGNEPSTGRAIGHGVLDVLTLGAWEIIGTPVEGFQGRKRQVMINYGPDDRVRGINQPVMSSPDKAMAQDQSDSR